MKNKKQYLIIMSIIFVLLISLSYILGLKSSRPPKETQGHNNSTQTSTEITKKAVLVLANDTATVNSNNVIIIGEVLNNGTNPARGVIVASVYDANGKLIGTGEGGTPVINPNGKHTVTIVATGNFSNYSNYKVEITPLEP